MKKVPLTTEDQIKRLERHKDDCMQRLGSLVECQSWVETLTDPYSKEFLSKVLAGEIKNLKLAVFNFHERIEGFKKTV